MRVLIACEFSGIVRDAFRARGHDAWSCDLLPSEGDSRFHIQGDAMVLLGRQGWDIPAFDLLVAHPPCTYLAVSGARWFHKRQPMQETALDFVGKLMKAAVPRIAIENPISVIS